MFPRTLLTATGLLALAAGCGAPPQPQRTSAPRHTDTALPPAATLPSAPLPEFSSPAHTPPVFSPLPGNPLPGNPLPGNPPPGNPLPENPPATRPTTTPPPATSPGPKPARAPRCTGRPTAAQIVAALETQPGVPDARLRVVEGPFCAAGWAFASVGMVGKSRDELEPLQVVTTGAGATLTVVVAGTDVCNARVQSSAPAGIRVLACGS